MQKIIVILGVKTIAVGGEFMKNECRGLNRRCGTL
jgi:hypothetical protein